MGLFGAISTIARSTIGAELKHEAGKALGNALHEGSQAAASSIKQSVDNALPDDPNLSNSENYAKHEQELAESIQQIKEKQARGEQLTPEEGMLLAKNSIKQSFGMAKNTMQGEIHTLEPLDKTPIREHYKMLYDTQRYVGRLLNSKPGKDVRIGYLRCGNESYTPKVYPQRGDYVKYVKEHPEDKISIDISVGTDSIQVTFDPATKTATFMNVAAIGTGNTGALKRVVKIFD